jgi:hypothetical protein
MGGQRQRQSTDAAADDDEVHDCSGNRVQDDMAQISAPWGSLRAWRNDADARSGNIACPIAGVH